MEGFVRILIELWVELGYNNICIIMSYRRNLP